MTATTAPLCITTLNNSVCAGSQCSAINKWPVDEIGRNSVIPSMIPRMTILNHKGGIRTLEAKTKQKTSRKSFQRRKPEKERHELREFFTICRDAGQFVPIREIRVLFLLFLFEQAAEHRAIFESSFLD